MTMTEPTFHLSDLRPWEKLGVSKEVYDWVRYTRVENLPGFARRPLSSAVSSAVLAELARTSIDEVERLLAEFATAVDIAAKTLLDTRALNDLDHVAIPGARLVAAGDSITADRLGWAEMLSALVARQSGNTTSVVNAGLAGSTSTDTVERLDAITASDPDLVILMIGTNDVRAQRMLPGRPLVSSDESARNFHLLIEGLTQQDRSLVVVTSPPLYDEPGRERLDGGIGEHSWDESALEKVVDVARTVAPRVIDLREPRVFDPADQRFMDADGVHPTARGQLEIAHRVLDGLAGVTVR